MTEEMYDVLDELGNKTGQVLTKSQVHEQELWHASVFIWIYNDKGEVLLQFRSKDKKCFPGVWDVSVAGHISAGNTPIKTAIREIEEEIGLHIAEKELKQIDYTSDIVPWLPDKKHPEFCWVYLIHKNLDLAALTIQKSELTAIKWMPIQELLADLQNPDQTKLYAQRTPRVFEESLRTILQSRVI